MPTKLFEVYRCRVCGNIVEVVHANMGKLSCCNQPMQLQAEKTIDAAKEKHVPVMEVNGDKVIVKVGAEPHPMDEDHYIEWIELIAVNGQVYRQALRPGDAPETVFNTKSKISEVRAYCNLHGLWSNK